MADTKLTAETVKAAVRDAEAGIEYEKTDPNCEGLQLRVRGGEVTFTVRARLFGNQRRWVIGDAKTRSTSRVNEPPR